MEDIIKEQFLRQQRKGVKETDIYCHVLYNADPKKFIASRLQSDQVHGEFHTFSDAGKQGRSYWVHRCMRAGKPTINSHRHVGCTAYASYKLERHDIGGNILIERLNLKHTGHLPDSAADKTARSVCSELEQKIKRWIELGVKSDVMLVQAHKWALSHGHYDLEDGSYIVTPADIKNIRKKYLRSIRIDESDAVSLNKLVTDTYKDQVLLYQTYVHLTQPLILVLQSEEMREDLSKCTSRTVFMDATNSVNKYGYPLWSLLVVNEFGRGVPVAHIIASEETEKVIRVALTALKDKTELNPRFVMVDKDYREIEAIQEVFPEAVVLLCYFHVLQAVHRWMISRCSGLSGTEHGLGRNEVISFFARLKDCNTEQEFDYLSHQFENQFDEFPALVTYFKDNWYPIGKMWANFGRKGNHENAHTNNICERFFLRLKYQFLGGLRNKRLDDLVTKLLTTAVEYFNVLHNLRTAGRLNDAKGSLAKLDSRGGDRLLSQGWAEKVINIGDGKFLVPSEFSPDVNYTVGVAECFCTCGRATQAIMCKHLHLIRNLQVSLHPSFDSLASCLAAHCEHLRNHPDTWKILSEETQVLEVDVIEHQLQVHATISCCTCPAHSFYNECSHIRLAQIVFGEIAPLVPDVATVECHEEPVPEVPEGHDHPTPEENSRILKLRSILEHLEEHPPSDSACRTIDKLHEIVFKCPERNGSRKTKPLHPYRKEIEIKRRKRYELLSNDQERHSEKQCTPSTSKKLPVPKHSTDHTMAKPPRKEPKSNKLDFRVRTTKTTIRKSTAPSLKSIVNRNKRQTEEVTFNGLKISKAAKDHIEAKRNQRPTDPVFVKSHILDLVAHVRLLSEHTVKHLSDEELFDFLHANVTPSN